MTRLVTHLDTLFREAGVTTVQPDADPSAYRQAAALAVERATAAERRVVERRAQAARLVDQIAEHERDARVAKALAQHLRADRFERWLLAEALDALVAGASRILRELTADQYDLAHDKGEFFVDRPRRRRLRRGVRTLSGGETFQASLALALALSEQLAGLSTAAASLESIMLDEGFGTLDSATLDTVAATLENLASRGDRMVGVVTHVSALAERIPVRFEVSKDARGVATVDERIRADDTVSALCGRPGTRRYGSPVSTRRAAGPTGESAAQLGLDVEVPAGGVAPLGRPGRPARARAWSCSSTACGASTPGSGSRRTTGRCTPGSPRPTRPAWCAATCAAAAPRWSPPGSRGACSRRVRTPTDSSPANARYAVRRVAASDPAQLSAAIQSHLHDAGGRRVRRGAPGPTADDDDLLVLDGPLRGRTQLPRALGYVKTHRVQYLPPELSAVVGRPAAGQRSPVFLLGTSWHRYTWYLQLPGPAGSPWAGVVRVEASADLPRGEVIRLADLSAVTLPRFASSAVQGLPGPAEPHADRRAGA